MSNSRQYITQPQEIQKSFETSSIGSSLSALSASDLDDMFENNLQLLENLKENKTDKYAEPRNFQSTLNIFIAPNKSQRLSTFSEHNKCEFISINNKKPLKMESINPRNLNIYSSYETLYDDIMFKKDEYDKVKDWECVSEPIHDNSKGSIDDYLKFGSVISLDSNKTLKSISSDNSSNVSSIKSDDQTFEINKSNQSLPIVSSMCNEVHMHTKLRYRPDRLFSRPKSYHPGESMGYYYSNKPLSYMSSNLTENKILRKEGTYAPSNVIISRSLKNSSIFSKSNSKSSIIITNNAVQSRPSEMKAKLSISSRNTPFNIPSNSNILNNNVNAIPRSSSNYLLNNFTVNPPVPPRNKTKAVVGKLTENSNQETKQPVVEVPVECPVKSCLNLIIDPHARNTKLNGLKFHLQSQNYGKNSSYRNNQIKSSTSTNPTDLQKKS